MLVFSQMKVKFPHVDFSLVRTDEDTWWQVDRRELVSEVIARARAFVRFLYTRPERNIAVVSHGVFLETLVSADVLGLVDPAVRGRRFANCEVRSLVVGGWSPGLRAAGPPASSRSSSDRHVRSSTRVEGGSGDRTGSSRASKPSEEHELRAAGGGSGSRPTGGSKHMSSSDSKGEQQMMSIRPMGGSMLPTGDQLRHATMES